MDQKPGLPNTAFAGNRYRGCAVLGRCHLPFNHLGNDTKGRGWFSDLFGIVYPVLAAKPALLYRARLGFYAALHRLWLPGSGKLVSSAPDERKLGSDPRPAQAALSCFAIHFVVKDDGIGSALVARKK